MESEGGKPTRVDNSRSKVSFATTTGRVSGFSSVWGDQSQVLENEEYLQGEMNLFSQSKKVFDLVHKQSPSYVVSYFHSAIRYSIQGNHFEHVHTKY
jgi:hypothetical protein